jgi:hypothetical protein
MEDWRVERDKASVFAGELTGRIVAMEWMPYRPIFKDGFTGHKLQVRYSEEDERLENEADDHHAEMIERYHKEIVEKRPDGEEKWNAEHRLYNHPKVNEAWEKYQTTMRNNIKKYFPQTVECKIPTSSPFNMKIDIPSFIYGIELYLWDTDVSSYRVKEVKHIEDYCWYFSVILELDEKYLE